MPAKAPTIDHPQAGIRKSSGKEPAGDCVVSWQQALWGFEALAQFD